MLFRLHFLLCCICFYIISFCFLSYILFYVAYAFVICLIKYLLTYLLRVLLSIEVRKMILIPDVFVCCSLITSLTATS